MRCELNFHFLMNRFKHIGDSQFLEIIAICHFMIMVLSCFDFVALITHHIGNFLLYLLAKRGSKFVIQDEVLSGSLCTVYISWILGSPILIVVSVICRDQCIYYLYYTIVY